MKSLIMYKVSIFSIILCFTNCARISNTHHSGHSNNMSQLRAPVQYFNPSSNNLQPRLQLNGSHDVNNQMKVKVDYYVKAEGLLSRTDCYELLQSMVIEMKEKHVLNNTYHRGRSVLSFMIEKASVEICSLFSDAGAILSSEVMAQLKRRLPYFRVKLLNSWVKNVTNFEGHDIAEIKRTLIKYEEFRSFEDLNEKIISANRYEVEQHIILNNYQGFSEELINVLKLENIGDAYKKLENMFGNITFEDLRVSLLKDPNRDDNVTVFDLLCWLKLTQDSPSLQRMRGELYRLDLTYSYSRLFEFAKKYQKVDLVIQLIIKDKINLMHGNTLNILNNAFEEDQMKEILMAWIDSPSIIKSKREHFFNSSDGMNHFVHFYAQVFLIMKNVGITKEEILLMENFHMYCLRDITTLPHYISVGNTESVKHVLWLLEGYYGRKVFSALLNTNKFINPVFHSSPLAQIEYSCYLAFVEGEAPMQVEEIKRLFRAVGATWVMNEDGAYQKNLLSLSWNNDEPFKRNDLVKFFIDNVNLGELLTFNSNSIRDAVIEIGKVDEIDESNITRRDNEFMKKYKELFKNPNFSLDCPICTLPKITSVFKTKTCGTCKKKICWDCYETCKGNNKFNCPLCRAKNFDITNRILEDVRFSMPNLQF